MACTLIRLLKDVLDASMFLFIHNVLLLSLVGSEVSEECCACHVNVNNIVFKCVSYVTASLSFRQNPTGGVISCPIGVPQSCQSKRLNAAERDPQRGRIKAGR